jgi:hypothetical protein
VTDCIYVELLRIRRELFALNATARAALRAHPRLRGLLTRRFQELSSEERVQVNRFLRGELATFGPLADLFSGIVARVSESLGLE